MRLEELLRTVDVYLPDLNYFSREWCDPVILLVLSALGIAPDRISYILVQQVIFFAGCFMTFPSPSKVERLLGSALLTFLCAGAVGFHPFLLKLQWFPLLLIALRGSSYPKVTFLLGPIFLLLWVITGGGLAIVGLIVAALLLLIRQQRVSIFLFGTGVALSLALMPVFEMPDYPKEARVAPVSPLTFEPIPFLSEKLLPNPIVHEALREKLLLTLGCSAAFLVALLLAGMSARLPRRELAFSVVLLFPFAELFLSPSFFSFAPIRSLYRLVPGLSLNPLPWLLMPFGFFAVVHLLSMHSHRRRFLVSGVVLAGAVFLAISLGGVHVGGVDDLRRAEIGGAENRDESIRHSPSAFILSRMEWAMDARSKRTNLRELRPGRDFQCGVEASVSAETAMSICDDRRESRWSTGRPQRPGDIILLTFDREVPAVALELNPGEGGSSDFPRGVLVESSTDGRTFVPLLRAPEWMGSLRWSASGYPYFGPQGEVFLDLPQEVMLKYLRITQLGNELRFNWSVADLSLYSLGRDTEAKGR